MGDAAVAAALLLAPFGGWIARPGVTGLDYAPFRAALAGLLVLGASAGGRPLPRGARVPVLCAVGLAAWALLGLGRTPNLVSGAAEAWDAAAAALAMAAVARRGGAFRPAAIRAVVLSALVVLAYAALQSFVLFPRLAPLLEGEARARFASGRAFGAFVSPGVLAGFLAVAACLAGGLGRRARAPTAGLLLVGLLLPRSLSGPAAAAAGLAAASAGTGDEGETRRRRLLPAVVAAAVLGAIALWRAPDLVERTGRSNPVALRLGTWAGALTAWAAAPLAGHGPGAFADAYMPRRGATGDETRRAHSWPLDVAVEGGLVGLVLWAGAVGGGLRAARAAPAPVRAAVWAFVAHNLVEISAYDPGLRVLGFALLGLCFTTKNRPGLSPRPEG